jgi:hypothetical protein
MTTLLDPQQQINKLLTTPTQPFPLFLSTPDNGSFLTSTFNVMSFYAPIIVIAGVFILSVFSASIGKSFVYIFWFFVATGMRSIIKKYSNSSTGTMKGDSVCSTGVFTPFLENTNLSYSTFALTFTLFYFIFPMIMVSLENKSNVFNYRVVIFFTFYIIFDIFIKNARNCMSNISRIDLFGDFIGGTALGIGATSIMYYTNRAYLFINEASSSAEVCAMPSNQKFKCSVTKNGEIISSTII